MSKKEPKHKKITKQSKRDFVGAKVFIYTTPKSPPALLYRLVYKSALSALLVFVLMTSFLLQGVYVVFANGVEDNVTVSAEVTESVVLDTIPNESPPVNPPLELPDKEEFIANNEEVEPLIGDFVVEETEATTSPQAPVEIELSNGSEFESSDMDNLVTVDQAQSDEIIEAVFADPQPADDDNQELLDTINESELPITDSLETETEIIEVNDSDLDIDNIESDPPVLPTNEEEENYQTPATTSASEADVNSATSSEEILAQGPVQDVAINTNFSDGAITFTKEECTELSSGSYYCLPPQVDLLDDALFAAPDSDGDLEIFLVRDGLQTQITQNLVDDASPFFDQNSESIVWHRLVEDRYQIIVYDLQSGEETQLTNGSSNNMEPNRQGKYIVWQKWTDNNWDIVLFDGTEETQISKSIAHDIAPYIHGSLIVWNRHTTSGDKSIEMYDIRAETYVTVDDSTGLSVANPRMVLVYDQLHPNGDIVTRGYDMITREFIQLDTLPRQLPDKIPESEPTSETRALIQSKPSVKGDEFMTPEVTPEFEPPIKPSLDLSSSTLDLTINMKTDVNVATSAPSMEITDFDLVIESFSPEIVTNSGEQD